MLLGISKLCNQRIIRCTEHGHKQIEENQRNQHPDNVQGAGRLSFLHAERREEDQHGNDGKGHGCPLHERDPAAFRVFAPVGQGSDPRIRHRVKNPADEGDQAEDRQRSENDQAGRHIEQRAFLDRAFRRKVICHQPGGHNTAENGPAQLANGKDPHFFFGETSGFHSLILLSFFICTKPLIQIIPDYGEKTR